MRKPWALPATSLILALLVWMVPLPVVRYTLAFILLWIIPGISWAGILPAAFTPLEQGCLALGLSFVITILTTLLAHYIPGPLTQPQLLIAIVSSTSLPWLYHILTPKEEQAQAKVKSEAAQTSSTSKVPGIWKEGWIWLLIALIIAAALRLTNLGYAEFQGDEGLVMVRAAQALEGEDAILFQHKKGPAEILTVMALWRLTGITNEWMARLPFAWANLLGIISAYCIARRTSSSHAAGIAALILAIEGYFTAFGRITQYQSIVFLLSTLGLLTLLAYHKSGQPLLVIASAVLYAGGFLAHYDAALALPSGLLLIGNHLWKERQQGWKSLYPVGLAALLGLVLIALFYLPFLRSPFMKATQAYFSERLGENQLFHNNLWPTFELSAVYNSIYLLGILTVALGIQCLQTWTRWGDRATPMSSQKRQIAMVLALCLCGLLVTGLVWPEQWVMGEKKLTLAWMPALILLSGAIAAPGQKIEKRALWLWLGIPALLYLFVVAIARTHVYTFILPSILLASIAIARISEKITAKPHVLRYVSGLVCISAYIICGYYTVLMFVDHTPEYRRTFPKFKQPFYWTPYEEIPREGLFGFPYRAGWKVVGHLMDQGAISSYYKSNEEPTVTDYYTHQATWWYCPNPDIYITAVHVQDEMGISKRQIREDYHPTVVVNVSGEPKLTIHERGSATGSPLPYDGEAYDWAFDLNTTPDRIARSQPKVETTLPAANTYTPVSYEVSDFATLRGYHLETAHAEPDGYVDLLLIWEAHKPASADYQVFTHLYDGETIQGQLDRQPLCGALPTSQWQSGQIIKDRYRIPIQEDAAPGTVPLVIGMYNLETLERVTVMTDAGVTSDNAIYLTDLVIQAQ